MPIPVRARAPWVLVPVCGPVPSRSCSLFARVIVGCSYPSVPLLVATRPAAVLLLVRYSPSGRAATRPLLVQRPCCYSSVARSAACRYSSVARSAAVRLLVRYSFSGRAATRPLLVRRPCHYPPGRLFVCLDIPTQASYLQLPEATAVFFY